MADFFWCMMAAQRGWSIEDTTNKLLEVSPKAHELHDEGYALITHGMPQPLPSAANRGGGGTLSGVNPPTNRLAGG
jgi:hypothetical protein